MSYFLLVSRTLNVLGQIDFVLTIEILRWNLLNFSIYTSNWWRIKVNYFSMNKYNTFSVAYVYLNYLHQTHFLTYLTLSNVYSNGIIHINWIFSNGPMSKYTISRYYFRLAQNLNGKLRFPSEHVFPSAVKSEIKNIYWHIFV